VSTLFVGRWAACAPRCAPVRARRWLRGREDGSRRSRARWPRQGRNLGALSAALQLDTAEANGQVARSPRTGLVTTCPYGTRSAARDRRECSAPV
jgi:hypothetical protein